MGYRLPLIVVVVALAGLTGCHPFKHLRSGGACHDTKPYMKAGSIAPLKIPAGADAPDSTSALHIPALNAPEPPARKRTDPCLDEPPPFAVPKQATPQA